MIKYLLVRVLQSIIIISFLSLILFVIFRNLPDPDYERMLNDKNITTKDLIAYQKSKGYDKPILEQYWNWVGDFSRLELGDSRTYHVPVKDLLWSAMGNTLRLNFIVFLISLLIALPIGILSSIYQYSRFDYVVNVLIFVGISIPSFWLGLVLQDIFAVELNLLPLSGISTIGNSPGAGSWLDIAKHMVLPVMSLTIQSIGSWARYIRGGMLETLQQDFVRTAYAKGLSGDVVILKHVLRNSLITMVTLLGLSLPGLFGGSIITEKIFNIPGMGNLFITAIDGADFKVAMPAFLFIAFLTFFFNLLADITYTIVDPRVKLGR